jgi:hypothetical protein
MSVRRGVQIQQGVEIDHVIMSLALAGNSRSGTVPCKTALTLCASDVSVEPLFN